MALPSGMTSTVEAARHRLALARRSATPQRIAELEHELADLQAALDKERSLFLSRLEEELRA